jgi:hypothetical protein
MSVDGSDSDYSSDCVSWINGMIKDMTIGIIKMKQIPKIL